MGKYINDEIRKYVAERANYLCEYCLIHEDDTFLKCEIDHIISLKHSGETKPENLASHAHFVIETRAMILDPFCCLRKK